MHRLFGGGQAKEGIKVSEKMSRRDFLRFGAKGAIGVAGLSMLGACSAPTPTEEQTPSVTREVPVDWADAADIVVVGGGGAGYCAAIEAARAGSSVIILEKSAICGGDTALSEGMIQAADTPEQRELAGFSTDTTEKFVQQQLAYAQGFANEDMIREMCEASPDHIKFMRDLGRVYKQVDVVAPAWEFDTEDSWGPRTHWNHDDKTGHFDALRAEVERLSNVRVLTEKPGAHLIADASNGIIGVTTEDGYHYRANKAVILATGSFGKNQTMTRKYNRVHYWTQSIADKMGTAPLSSPNITGDGIRMAQEVGAGLAICDSSVTSNMIETGGVGSGYYADLAGIDYHNIYNSTATPGRILVNTSGQRFVQEDALWGYVNKRVYEEALRCGWSAKTEPKIWFIQDDKWQKFDPAALGAVSGPLAQFCKQADTIEELAELIGVPAKNLKETVERWNAACAAGEDKDFKRRVDMKPIEVGPFHAYPYSPVDSGTFGGVDTDIDTRVLDANGQVIPRLYAAGTIMAGTWCGQFYSSCGWAILGTVHWGRKAGVNSVQLSPWTTEEVVAKEQQTQKVVGQGNYKAGTYTATATGYGGDVPVTVSFSDTEILSVEVGENGETPNIGGEAMKLLTGKIVNQQTADLDAVSGATFSSKAVLEAVKDCIAQASK